MPKLLGLAITDDGQLTWRGRITDQCPEPFDDCRPGACDCDGLRDQWRAANVAKD